MNMVGKRENKQKLFSTVFGKTKTPNKKKKKKKKNGSLLELEQPMVFLYMPYMY